jgi:asparagine synthase (glutamine-hydrolysing)
VRCCTRTRARWCRRTIAIAFCYLDRKFDERRYIFDTQVQTSARLVNLQMTPALWDSLPQLLVFQDEPVHSMTALVGFHLYRLAASHGVKVVLCGQGADETMAGYGSYFKDYWYQLVREGSLWSAAREIGAHAAAHGGSPHLQLARTLHHTARTMLGAHPVYRALAARQRRQRVRAEGWVDPGLARHLAEPAPQDRHLRAVLAHSVVDNPLPLYLRGGGSELDGASDRGTPAIP